MILMGRSQKRGMKYSWGPVLHPVVFGDEITDLLCLNSLSPSWSGGGRKGPLSCPCRIHYAELAIHDLSPEHSCLETPAQILGHF